MFVEPVKVFQETPDDGDETNCADENDASCTEDGDTEPLHDGGESNVVDDRVDETGSVECRWRSEKDRKAVTRFPYVYFHETSLVIPI